MEAGTRELLGKAEGKVWGHVDKEDDVFEFGSRAITEDALLEMRQRNAQAAHRAMADLGRHGGRFSLPAVSAAAARRPPGRQLSRISLQLSSANSDQVKPSAGFNKAARAAPGVPPRRKGQPRAQTPTEVRSAAEQEMLADEQEKERWANARPRSARNRPAPVDGKGAVGAGKKREEEGSGGNSLAREAALLFRILDWQKTARSRGFDIAKMLSLDPQVRPPPTLIWWNSQGTLVAGIFTVGTHASPGPCRRALPPPACLPLQDACLRPIQGYLAHEKHPPP
jgi:hypothetical protein